MPEKSLEQLQQEYVEMTNTYSLAVHAIIVHVFDWYKQHKNIINYDDEFVGAINNINKHLGNLYILLGGTTFYFFKPIGPKANAEFRLKKLTMEREKLNKEYNDLMKNEIKRIKKEKTNV